MIKNTDRVENLHYALKKKSRMTAKCIVCGEDLEFGVELNVLENVKQFPFAHLIIHGNPIHALIIYIDANFKVRGVEPCESIEILRDSQTFSQMLSKWSNPF